MHNQTAIMETVVTETEERRYAELQHLALDAARSGDSPKLASMVRAGLPVNLQDHRGNTLLMLASYHGHTEIVEALLDCDADPDRRNLRGQTPLGGVAFKGYVEIATLLLDAGADPNADQGGGMTPLMLASLFGRTEMVRLAQIHECEWSVHEQTKKLKARGEKSFRLGLLKEWRTQMIFSDREKAALNLAEVITWDSIGGVPDEVVRVACHIFTEGEILCLVLATLAINDWHYLSNSLAPRQAAKSASHPNSTFLKKTLKEIP